MKNAEKPLLSISLLTSDRLDTIPRCLDSLTPIREAFPCELIIVDTSNNPEVHECILKYTDIVEKFEWCNDFSKARNVGVKKAKGEWFMFLDDDEWFMDSEPLIEFFKSGEYKQYGFAFYKVRNFLDEDFSRHSDAWVKRLTKLTEETRFKSKVHEYISPNIGDRKLIETIVGHSGYIYKTKEDKQKHFERNTTLLQKMEKEEPDQLNWKIQYIQEYMCMSDWVGLENYCKEVIDALQGKKTIVRIADVAQIYIGYMYAMVNNGKYEESLTVYKKCRKLVEKLFYLRAFTDIIISETYYRLEKYELLYERAKEYQESYIEFHENISKYEVEELGNVFTDTFTPKMHRTMSTYMLFATLELGKSENLSELYSELMWDTPNQRLLYIIHTKLFEVLTEMEDYDMLETTLKRSLEADGIKEQIKKRILIYREEDKKIFLGVMDALKSIDVWQWYNLYAELLSQYQRRGTDEIREIAIEIVKATPNVFQMPIPICEQFKRVGVETETLYKELDFMTWKNQVAEHFECMNMKQLETLKDTLMNSSLNGDVRFTYFMMLYAEQKLLHTDEADMDFETYNELLYAFSSYTCATFETLYADEISNMELEQWPHNYQAALWLKVYFEEVEKDIKTALPCLSKVIEVYPMFSDVVRSYLKCIQSEILG